MMTVLEMIRGRRVVLLSAGCEDMVPIYGWLARSDLTSTMVGPPTYPERPVPTWDEFRADYPDHYFDGSSPELGRCFVILADGEPVGQVNYNDIHEQLGRKRVELDIWLRSGSVCGRGFGTDALDALCRHLSRRFRVQEFMVQPSARNPRAIAAYEKAGFVRLGIPVEEARRFRGPSDYVDSLYMVRMASASDGVASERSA